MALGDESPDTPIGEAGRQRAVQRSGAVGRRGDRELQRIVDFAASRYDTAFAAASIVGGHREILLSRSGGVTFWEVPRSESFCAVAIQRPGEPLIVGDAAADPRFASFPVVRSAPHVRFYAGMSIVDRDGYALGALCVADPQPRATAIDPVPLILFAREAERLLWR